MEENENGYQDKPPYRRRASDDVEVSTPFGSVRARGRQASSTLIIICIAAVIVFFVKQYTDDRVHHDATVDADHKQLASKLDEMVYIISLPEKERAEISLSMPESLRMKMSRNSRYETR